MATKRYQIGPDHDVVPRPIISVTAVRMEFGKHPLPYGPGTMSLQIDGSFPTRG